MRKSDGGDFTIRKSDWVKVHSEKKSDGVRVHDKKERWAEKSQ